MYETPKLNTPKLEQAIRMLLTGAASKVDIDKNTKVYLCKNIVRIDIKLEVNARDVY